MGSFFPTLLRPRLTIGMPFSFYNLPSSVSDIHPYSKLAIETAAKAFESWQHSAPVFRASIIRKASELVVSEKYKQRIIDSVVEETGSVPLWADISNVSLASAYLSAGLEMPYQVKGEILPSDYPGNQVFIKKRPMGVMYVVSRC